MLLRLAKKDEIETITKISVEAFHTDYLVGMDANDGPPDYDSAQWHAKMQAQNCLYAYVDDNGIVVGGAVLFASSEKVYVGRIFIAPKYHGKGYGTKLMNDIENAFSSANLFKLDTPLNNVRTNAFYKKLGYVQTAVDGDCVTYVKEIERNKA